MNNLLRIAYVELLADDFVSLPVGLLALTRTVAHRTAGATEGECQPLYLPLFAYLTTCFHHA
jgi:hypothetical protein